MTVKEIKPDEFDKELIADSMIDNNEEMDFDDYVRSLGYDPIEFRINNETPNQETLEALAELKYMKAHPEEYKRYVSVEAMMNDILGEEDND